MYAAHYNMVYFLDTYDNTDTAQSISQSL